MNTFCELSDFLGCIREWIESCVDTKKKHKIIEEGAGFMSVVHKYLCVLLMQEDLEGELDGAVFLKSYLRGFCVNHLLTGRVYRHRHRMTVG